MKTIVLLRGWVEDYMEDRLKALGHKVICLDYYNLPCAVIRNEDGESFISVNDTILLKGNKAAICPTGYVWHNDAHHLAYRSKESALIALDDIDCVICRITMWKHVEKGLSILEFFRERGIPTSEKLSAYDIARSKIKSHTCFMEHGINTPDTLCLYYTQPDYEEVALSFYKKYKGDICLKSDLGSVGKDIFFPTSQAEFEENLAYYKTKEINLVAQKIIRTEGNPRHYRVEVINGEVLAADLQIAKDGEMKSNLAQGASVHKAMDLLTPEQKALCLKATKAAGVNFCGVDMMVDEDGTPFIIEINITPDVWRGAGDEHLHKLVDKTLEACFL